MADLAVLDGSTFFVSNEAGDIDPGHATSGFFFRDTRHLSQLGLVVNGETLNVLTSRAVYYYYAARVFATLPAHRDDLRHISVQPRSPGG